MGLKNRFVLRMGDDMASDLQGLAQKYEVNQATVLCKALALYAEVKSDKDNQVFLKYGKTNKIIRIVNI